MSAYINVQNNQHCTRSLILVCKASSRGGYLFSHRRFIARVLNANIYDQSLGLVLRFVWLVWANIRNTAWSDYVLDPNPKKGLSFCVCVCQQKTSWNGLNPCYSIHMSTRYTDIVQNELQYLVLVKRPRFDPNQGIFSQYQGLKWLTRYF